jgi:hypothetical protein
VVGAAALLAWGGTAWSLGSRGLIGTPEPRLALVSQTPIVEPGQPAFTLTFRLVGGVAPAPGTKVAVTVYDGLSSRSALDQSLRDRGLVNPLVSFAPTDLDQLPRNQTGDFELTVPVETASGTRGSSPAVDLAGSPGGVYPLVVTLMSATTGEVVQRLVTYLVFATPSAQSQRVDVALVLPLQAPVRLSDLGRPSLSTGWSAALSGLAHQLAANPKVPLTLAPSPVVVEALADSSRPQDRLTLALLAAWAQSPGHEVLPAPYAPVSFSALVHQGLAAEVFSQVSRAEQVLDTDLKVAPAPSVWMLGTGPLDRDALDALEGLHVKDLVVAPSELAPVATKLTPAQPFVLEGAGQYRPLSLAVDSGLTSHFTSTDPVLGAHQALADLAQIYFEEPNSPTARAVVVAPPEGWIPNPGFVESFLRGLDSNPTVKPATLSQVFTGVSPETVDGSVRQRQPAPDQPNPPTLPGAALAAAREHTEALLSAAGGQLQLSGLDDLLLAAESSSISPRQRGRYLSALHADIQAQLSQLSLPGAQTVTLTATTGRIPITIESRAPYPVRAVIAVSSDKLAFARGSTRVVTLDQRDTTEYFDVRARSPGDFPLQVSLMSPQGHLILLHGRLTVRSTAASRVAIGLTAGAGAFLTLWWGRSLLRSRRARVTRR